MPVPKGYTLDASTPQLPAGYTLDAPKRSPMQPPVPSAMQADPAPVPPAVAAPPVKIGGVMDTIGNIGAHLKNMVTGPLNAVAQPPQGAAESAISKFDPTGGALLPAYRMTVKPTVDALGTAVQQAKKGNLYSNEEYDQQGNYQPSAFSSALDAVPLAGPWARNIETDAHQKGVAPALAGMATDVLAPKIAAKGIGIAAQGAGKAAQLASADASSLKLYGTRTLVPGNPGELLQSALKPGVKYGAGAGQTLASSLPDVLGADPNLQGVSGFAKAADAAKDASYQPYNNLVSPYRPPVGGVGPVRPGSINGNPIADAQNASIPAINRFESQKPNAPLIPVKSQSAAFGASPMAPPAGGIVHATEAKADLYRRPIPISQADSIREDANAKLSAFYGKAGGDQNAALSNPETSRVKAIGDTTRLQLYPKLESDAGLTPGSVAAMQQKYGILSDVADIANKREPVFARHDPISLSQKIIAGHGNPLSMAWNYGVQKGLKGITNSDALVNSAVDQFKNPAGTPLAARPGILPQAGMGAGNLLYGSGKAIASAPLALNPIFYSVLNPPKR